MVSKCLAQIMALGYNDAAIRKHHMTSPESLTPLSSDLPSASVLSHFLGDPTNPAMVAINHKLNGDAPLTSEDERELSATFEKMTDADLRNWDHRLLAARKNLQLTHPILRTIIDSGRAIHTLIPGVEICSTNPFEYRSHIERAVANLDSCRLVAYEVAFGRISE